MLRELTMPIVMAGLLSGCASFRGGPNAHLFPVAITADEAMIYETVFRYQMSRHTLPPPETISAYCISIRGADPSDAFLLRFSEQAPPVLKASDAYTVGGGIVYARGKKGLAFKFSVGEVRWIDENTVDVEGGYSLSSLAASGNIYRLVRRGAHWTVVKDTLQWISEFARKKSIKQAKSRTRLFIFLSSRNSGIWRRSAHGGVRGHRHGGQIAADSGARSIGSFWFAPEQWPLAPR